MPTAGSALGSSVWVLLTNPSFLPLSHCRWVACQLCDGTSGCCTVLSRWCAGTVSPAKPVFDTSGAPSGPSGKPSPRPGNMPR